MDADEECEKICEPGAAADEFGQYPRTCGSCGFEWLSNHCMHELIQNPCPKCGWKKEGSMSPLEYLGLK